MTASPQLEREQRKQKKKIAAVSERSSPSSFQDANKSQLAEPEFTVSDRVAFALCVPETGGLGQIRPSGIDQHAE